VATPSLHTLIYTTRRGDTLVSIADRFGVSLDQLRRWNKIPSGIKVEPGRRLHVAEPATVQRSTTRHRGANSKSSSAKTHAPSSVAKGAVSSSSEATKHSVP
jgi:membrane-bound lytic murein transglycosylase D